MKFSKVKKLFTVSNYYSLKSFLESYKKVLKDLDYNFYKQLLNDIDLEENLLNVNHKIDFLRYKIFKSILKNIL